MRINIYGEEITSEVGRVTTTADTGAEFVGIRFYLESSPKLHNRPDDRGQLDLQSFQRKATHQNARTKIALTRYTAEEWAFAMIWQCEPGDVRQVFVHVEGHAKRYGRGPTGAICGPNCKCNRQWKGRDTRPTKQQLDATERIYNNNGK